MEMRTTNHQSPITKSPRAGFTLVELLVAIALFSIAVSIAVGGFVRALRTQRQLVALIAANSNASLAIEQMARELRTSRDFSCVPQGSRICEEIAFTAASGEEVAYRKNGATLERRAGAQTEQLTALNVDVRSLSFVLFGNEEFPPRITITMGVGSSAPGLEGSVTNLQTTISSREL